MNFVEQCHSYGSIFPTFLVSTAVLFCFVGDPGYWTLWVIRKMEPCQSRPYTANWCILGLSFRIVTSRMKTRFNFTCDLNTCYLRRRLGILLFYARDQQPPRCALLFSTLKEKLKVLLWFIPVSFPVTSEISLFHKFITSWNWDELFLNANKMMKPSKGKGKQTKEIFQWQW